jgi:hypothetical protein
MWMAAIEAAHGRPAMAVAGKQALRETLHIIRPDLSGLIALGASAAGLNLPGATIFSREDTLTPGKILPNKALEKTAAYSILRTNPIADCLVSGDTSHLEERLRMYEDALNGNKDALKQIGESGFYGALGSVGVYDYRRDAEQTLALRSRLSRTFEYNFQTLMKKDPAQAARWVQDPQTAAYLMFHNDFASMSRSLRQLDDAYDRAKTDAERKQIETARKGLLANSELLNSEFLGAESRKAVEKAKSQQTAASSLRTPSNSAPVSAPDFIPAQAQ